MFPVNLLFGAGKTPLPGILMRLLPFVLLVAQAQAVTLTTAAKISFQDRIFLANAPQPEWVAVSGTVSLLTHVTR